MRIGLHKHTINFLAIPLSLLFFGSLNVPMMAYADYYDDHAVGWQWYQDPPPSSPKKPKVAPSQNASENGSLTPATDEMKALQALELEARNKAVLNPTVQNVSNFMMIQNKISNNAETFAKSWATALLLHPELNYSLIHPTESLAIQVEADQRSDAIQKAIQQFSTQYGLLFFYVGDSPYSKAFAPILKSVVSQYHLTLIPVTLDGVVLPEFPDSRVDHGEAQKLQVNETYSPALFVVNPKTHEMSPLGYGFMSQSEIESALNQFIKNHLKNIKNTLSEN